MNKVIKVRVFKSIIKNAYNGVQKLKYMTISFYSKKRKSNEISYILCDNIFIHIMKFTSKNKLITNDISLYYNDNNTDIYVN